MNTPRKPHLQAALHVVKYLAHTLDWGLFYPSHTTLNANSHPFVILTGEAVHLVQDLLLAIVFSWATVSFHGRQRSRKQFQNPQLRLSIDACPIPLVRLFG